MRQARQTAADAEREAVTATPDTARALRDELGLSVRDVAQLLGVTHGRIAQVLNEETTPAA